MAADGQKSDLLQGTLDWDRLSSAISGVLRTAE